jgi:hypothetical protein
MILEETKERLGLFREMQLLPLAKELDYENWLNNFETDEDKEIAAHILKFFIYFPDDMVNKLLKTVVGRCGYYFLKHDSSWTHESFMNNCWYSFIQGEVKDDITDSGYIFTRKLRDELNIPNDRILSNSLLFEKLETSSTAQNVILVDDFVGTGAQTDTAWNNHRYGKFNYTLHEHVKSLHHNIVYATLVANEMGLKRIASKCAGLHMEYIYKLTKEYSLLDVNGLCWKGDKAKFTKFIDLLKRVAQQEGIPITYGYNVNDILGFGRQGLALAFSHGIPDACPAFFYWNTPTWKPLKKRSYHR